MHINETPQISGYANTSNTYSLGGLGIAMQPSTVVSSTLSTDPCHYRFLEDLKANDQLSKWNAEKSKQPIKEKAKMTPAARVVQVFIVDQDKNLPLDKRLLHKTEQIFTDMNDQDLFFDLDIKKILADHNAERVNYLDKKKSSATEKVLLEPVRVSDLKMVVSVIAEF